MNDKACVRRNASLRSWAAGAAAAGIRELLAVTEDGPRQIRVRVGVAEIVVGVVVVDPLKLLALAGAVSSQYLQLRFPHSLQAAWSLGRQVGLRWERTEISDFVI